MVREEEGKMMKNLSEGIMEKDERKMNNGEGIFKVEYVSHVESLLPRRTQKYSEIHGGCRVEILVPSGKMKH